jgi:transposase-like protein
LVTSAPAWPEFGWTLKTPWASAKAPRSDSGSPRSPRTVSTPEAERDRARWPDGLRAAEAKGGKGGRRPAVPAEKTDAVRTAYLEGRSIAALACEHGVSRGAIRTAVVDLMPERAAAGHEDVPALELRVTLDMPGKVADFLSAAELEPAERAELDHGVTVRRGQGYTLRVSAVPSVHRGLLAYCRPPDGTQDFPVVPAQRKARREYEPRVGALAPAGP